MLGPSIPYALPVCPLALLFLSPVSPSAAGVRPPWYDDPARFSMTRPRSRRLRFAPRIDLLEDRRTPATVSVDAAANVHAIDPYIYGSAFADTAQLLDLRLPLNRNGGNAS